MRMVGERTPLRGRSNSGLEGDAPSRIFTRNVAAARRPESGLPDDCAIFAAQKIDCQRLQYASTFRYKSLRVWLVRNVRADFGAQTARSSPAEPQRYPGVAFQQ